MSLSVSIKIKGGDEVQRMLGVRWQPTMAAATKAIALDIQGKIAPYPPATLANSPANPMGRWYERGYGSKWMRKDGSAGGRATSQTMGRRWSVGPRGAYGAVVSNSATYAQYLHNKQNQVAWAKSRGWVSDEAAIQKSVQSGSIQRIVSQAIMAAMRRR